MKSRSRHSISIRFAYVLDMRSSRLWRGRDRIAETWDASWAQLASMLVRMCLKQAVSSRNSTESLGKLYQNRINIVSGSC